ncbi:transmembrane amino acid transporter [Pyronema domesticum]|uniref:Similar to Vacuolar amino acid transporter 2 acc. no. P39981 n=1 Tax=Pyronema omphalodes (strain CBS 100304) TaxID=1076935 RepID=U4LW18_PYROM|nr:transmembrane amino acid transporter [Pyronema domesticum]CCX33066.1 Similar to Vacuolar amino acid transporter 2; acc. no. P39981 [Pyronema omphalodes CBS 100304]
MLTSISYHHRSSSSGSSDLISRSSASNSNSFDSARSTRSQASEDLVVTSSPDIATSFRARAPPRPTDIANPTPRTPNRVRFALDDDAIELDERGSEDDIRWADDRHGGHGDYDGDEGDGDDRPLLNGGSASASGSTFDFASAFGSGGREGIEGLEGYEELEALGLDTRPKSGGFNAFMNMANSIIGAGIIGQPYAFRQAGLAAGIVLLVGLTIVVDWTINLIVINSKLSGANSFQATVQHCFGKPGLIAISIAQWAFAFGGMIAFCIIIGDSIPHVILALFPKINEYPVLWVFANRKAVIIIFTMAISYPLTLYRDIAKLAKASAFALVSMLIIVFTVVTQGFSVPKEDRGEFTFELLTINTGFFQAIGVISFAFVCHHNSLLIYNSLRTPTLNRFSRVTHFSTTISCLLCLLMALSGFFTFRSRTQGNVLNNFPSSSLLVNFARFCFGLNMLTTLPLEAFVCREVMETYFWPSKEFSLTRHVVISTGLNLAAVAVSCGTCDLGVVFELVGATSACALAYVLPPVCYIKLARRSWRTYAAGGVAGFGGAVMVISVAQAVGKIVRGEEGGGVCV